MSRVKILAAGDVFQPWRGVFETLRVDRGNARFVEEHAHNLREACAALGLKPRLDFTRRTKELPWQTGRWRWVVTAERSYDLFQSDARPVRPGFRVGLSPVCVGSANWDARWKTLSYLAHWQARETGEGDESLVRNERGEITGGAMSNLFWVRKGRIFTPPLAAGCRNGVVRQWVCARVPVRERRTTWKDLAGAEEIFLTNSWIGIKPVVAMADKRLKAGMVTRQLQREMSQAYRKAAQ